jgi:ribosome-binding factor A
MRKDRVASVLERELSMIIAQDLNDPRLNLVTITKVTVSPDIKNATVYFSSLKKREEVLKVLQGAKGCIRTHLAHRIRIKTIPDLIFAIDDTFERGQRIDALLKEISKHDQEE